MHDNLEQLAVLAVTIPPDHRVVERLVAVEAWKLLLDVGSVPCLDPIGFTFRLVIDSHGPTVAAAIKQGRKIFRAVFYGASRGAALAWDGALANRKRTEGEQRLAPLSALR